MQSQASRHARPSRVRQPLTSALIAALVTSSLLGCSASVPRDPIRYSIEELGAEVADRAGGQGQQYRTAISITGISLPHAVGQLISVPEDATRGALPDFLATAIQPTCSRIVETKYDLADTANGPQVVASLAGALEQLSAINLALAVARARLAVAKTGVDRAAALGGDAAKIKEDGQAKLAATSLGLPEPTAAGFASKQAEFQKTVMEHDAALSKAMLAYQELKKTPNVVVARWSRAEQTASSFGLGAILGLRDQGKQERKGYLVLGGVRVTTLLVGNDVLYRLRNTRQGTLYGADGVFDKAYFTINTVSARHVAFTEEADLEQALALSLKLDPDQLKQLVGSSAGTFLLGQAVSVESLIARAMTAGTGGVLTASKIEHYPFRFWGDAVLHASRHEELKRSAGYTTVYATRSNIDKVTIPNELLQRFEQSTVYPRCAHAVPAVGALREVDYEHMGSKFCLPIGWTKGAISREISPMDWKPDVSEKTCIDLSRPIKQ